jgi:ankyrin repeat protein
MRVWTEAIYCTAGAVVQGLLYARHAAVAQTMTLLVAMHAAYALVCFDDEAKWRFWTLLRRCKLPKRTVIAFVVGVHAVVLSQAAAVLYTNFFWTATIVFALPALTPPPLFEILDVFTILVFMLTRPVKFVRGLREWFSTCTEPFFQIICTAVPHVVYFLLWTAGRHVVRVCFPANRTVRALRRWVDAELEWAEEQDEESGRGMFTAAQTGQLAQLEQSTRRCASWRYMCSSGACAVRDRRLGRALSAAAANGHVDCVGFLLNAGTVRDKHLAGALRHASRSDEAESVRLLLAAKANVHDGEALYQAVTNGAGTGVVAQLLEAGSPVVAPCRPVSPLGEAARLYDTPDIVRQLLGAKALPDRPDYHGHTALCSAAMNVTARRTDIVQLLLDAKADVNGNSRQFPLDVAATDDVAALLLANGARSAHD